MRNNLSKFTKTFTSIACFSIILISNNSELAAKFLPDKKEEKNKNKINLHNLNKSVIDQVSSYDFINKNNVLIVDNGEKNSEENILISEIIIEGWEDHPEGRRLELAA